MSKIYFVLLNVYKCLNKLSILEGNFKEETIAKLRRVCITKYASFDDKDVDENSSRIFASRPIPWESTNFKKYKRHLNEFVQKKAAKKGVQQSTLRKVGEPSENAITPALVQEDDWIISSKFKNCSRCALKLETIFGS